MAQKVGFFTPVSFPNQPKSATERLLEKVDGYFYLRGPKAHVLKPGLGAVLVNESQSLLTTCLKVASYFSFLLLTIPFITKAKNPLSLTCFALVAPIMFITKAILRLTHPYEIDPRSIKAQQHQQIDTAVIDTLGLNLEEEDRVDARLYKEKIAKKIQSHHFTLKQAAEEVIATINKAIQEKSDTHPEASLQEKHFIKIYTEASRIQDGSNLFFYANYFGLPGGTNPYEREQIDNLWFNRIIKALVDRNHIRVYQYGELCEIQA